MMRVCWRREGEREKRLSVKVGAGSECEWFGLKSEPWRIQANPVTNGCLAT